MVDKATTLMIYKATAIIDVANVGNEVDLVLHDRYCQDTCSLHPE